MKLPKYSRVALAQKEVTQKQVAETLGYCVPTVRAVLLGNKCTSNFRQRARKDIFEYLGLTPEDIV